MIRCGLVHGVDVFDWRFGLLGPVIRWILANFKRVVKNKCIRGRGSVNRTFVQVIDNNYQVWTSFKLLTIKLQEFKSDVREVMFWRPYVNCMSHLMGRAFQSVRNTQRYITCHYIRGTLEKRKFYSLVEWHKAYYLVFHIENFILYWTIGHLYYVGRYTGG